MSKIVALYCRVSTPEQAEEGYSIEEQERLLRKFCEDNDYTIFKVYSDKGISGKSIKARPAMKEMLKDADDKKFDMVITWKINRIARNMLNLLQIVDLLEKNNISFKSYSENFETETPMGKFSLQMMGAVGELERGTIAQNVKMGMLARAREGRWNGNILLGYNLKEKSDSTNKKRKDTELVINEVEAEIIKTIFTMYSEGNGYKAITSYLNKFGYTTKRGNPFSVNAIKDILKNPVYIGKIRYNVLQNWSEKRRRHKNANPLIVEGIHEPIIAQELWDKVQKMMEDSKGKPSRIYDGEFPLTGILKCPVCGSGMVIMRSTNTRKDGTKHRIEYYCCGAWKNKGTAVCHSNSINVNKANDYVFNKLSELLNNDKLIKDIVVNMNTTRKAMVDPSKDELEKILKELEKLEAKKKKVFEAYEEEIITKKDFSDRMADIKSREEMLQQEVNNLKSNILDDGVQEVSYEFVREILSSFSKMLSELPSREQQKKLLHMLISKITINKTRDIESIELNINDNLIMYLSNGGEPSPDGGGSPSYYGSRRRLMINPVNIKICI
ncbi:recombinase family protein [Clostridium butyricum]|uniref:DNA-invertase hin n=3 Tax=Clostridium TaxID=1485 RepID=A0A6N3GU83_CLOBU|nr:MULTISPECIES: recombinase family protein [Clostridium]MZI79958.1 recombinase family protein [Clostridium butyricum]POO86604.1 resolvase [Clostridium sp. 3-3]QUF82846.1 recombinase family protein [Clostridium butyricum]